MLTFTRSFKYMQLLTWHSNLVCVNCGCLSFCNTKTTIIFLTDTIPNHWCTLVLHVADEYLGCIYCVWIVDFNTIPNKWKAFVRYHIDAFVWQSLALNGNKYYKFWVCFWSLCYPSMQGTTYLRFIMLSSMASLAPLHFSTKSNKRHKFLKIFVENWTCVRKLFCLKHFSIWE